ncbi:MAG TPA: DNA topoisomerase IB [Blastocatellia bacterium]|nr:DNA topoisomerase IB [Blastocatellia bacterium]
MSARNGKENGCVADPIDAAKSAGLRYVSDSRPGITRRRAGSGFCYAGPDGQVIKDAETLKRIKSLAIPPAWTDVWICPTANGHIQATGRDAKGRKQYRYHNRWRAVRDETKYDRLLEFGQALSVIRERTRRDLELKGMPREKVLATIVRLFEATLIRIGNEEYARNNGSFGLTTMRDHHVRFSGSSVRFRFRGKSGIFHEIGLDDRRLAKIVKHCRDIPGQELFQYLDEEGQPQTINSSDVNEYLREITGGEFTAKDFRTWSGTVLASLALQELKECSSETEAKKNIICAIEGVASQLGNTPAVCRKYYVHPAIIDLYLEGKLFEVMEQSTGQKSDKRLKRLRPEEIAVISVLRLARNGNGKARAAAA